MNNKRKIREDLTGMVFNRLTVLGFSHYCEKDHPYWRCKCVCGNERLVTEHGLRKNKVKSCGCYKIINIGGKRIGRLVVQDKYEKRGDKYYWLVKCDCGKEAWKSGESLRKGNTQSCGCWLIESRYVDKNHDRTDLMLGMLYKKLVSRHKKISNSPDVISYQQYKKIVFDRCYYCNSTGLSIIRDVRKEKKGRVFITENVLQINGVDRMDNALGYTRINSIACCKVCNVAKHVQDIRSFKKWVISIYNHWASRSRKQSIAEPLFDRPKTEQGKLL